MEGDGAQFTLTVLGTRGSMAINRPDCAEFGGSTSCYLVRAGNETVILDAGTGLLRAPSSFAKPPVLLLSHLHLDHVMGLGMYGRLSRRGAETYLYVPARDAEEAQRLLGGLYAPPYWPLELTRYAGTLHVEAMPSVLHVGPVAVETMEGSHPGESLVFRLRYAGKTLVYATDFEHETSSFDRLTRFAKGADLLLYDAQYSEEEYETRRGFGHSTPQRGMELLQRSGAKRLLLIHHDPGSTDEVLFGRESILGRDDARFAREGETIAI